MLHPVVIYVMTPLFLDQGWTQRCLRGALKAQDVNEVAEAASGGGGGGGREYKRRGKPHFIGGGSRGPPSDFSFKSMSLRMHLKPYEGHFSIFYNINFK